MSESSSPHVSASAGLESSGVATETEVDPLLAPPDRPCFVLVVGASGFVGRHLLRRLSARGHRIRAVARARRGRAGADTEWVTADIADPAHVRGLAEGCDVLVNLAGVWREGDGSTFTGVHDEGTRHLVSEALDAGIERFIHLSVLGAADREDAFFGSKFEGDRHLLDSALQHVIFRPSVIFGPGDHFTTVIARWLRRLPLFPVPGSDSLLLQPVAIEDAIDALCQAVEREDVTNLDCELLGPGRLGCGKIVRTIAGVLRLRRPVVPVEGFLSESMAGISGRMGLPVRLARGQAYLFRRRRAARRSENALRKIFNIEPLPFREALEDYL